MLFLEFPENFKHIFFKEHLQTTDSVDKLLFLKCRTGKFPVICLLNGSESMVKSFIDDSERVLDVRHGMFLGRRKSLPNI